LAVTRLEDRRLLSAGLSSYITLFPGRQTVATASPTATASAPVPVKPPPVAPAAARAAQVNPYPRGGYAAWSLGNSLTGVKFDPGIVGISLEVPWELVQKGPTSYNWSLLDARLQEAQAAGLKVALTLEDGPTHAPAFLLNNPAVHQISLLDTNSYHTTYGQTITGPVPWDPTYLADHIAFIKAAGARYAGNPVVVAVSANAVNWYSDDGNLPTRRGEVTIGSTTYQLNQVAQWLAAGYTEARMEAAIRQVMDATAAAFPHQTLKLAVGMTAPGLDGTSTALAAYTLNYGYAKYAGRVVGQVNFLSAVAPVATDPTLGQDPNTMGYLFHLLEQHGGAIGLRMLGSATDGPNNGYRDNGGVAAPAATVLQNAVTTGLTYRPMFLEYWANDASNSALANTVQQATDVLQGKGSGGGSGGQVNPYTRGGYASWALTESLAGVKFDPGIVGINLHVIWNEVQTGPTSYDWTQLDARVREAQALGLKVTLMLVDGGARAPAFLLSDPAVQQISLLNTNPYQSTYGQMQTGPVYWDPTYLAARVAFIKAMGARYTDNPTVVAVTTNAVNWGTDDWHVSTRGGQVTIGSTTYKLNQLQQWVAAGYTDAKMESAIREVMDATAAAFSHQTLKLEVGVTSPKLDGTGTTLAAYALNYGYAHYGSRLVSQVNYLSAVSPAAGSQASSQDPNSMNYVFHLLQQHGGAMGLQMLGSVTNDPTTSYRDNGGVAAPGTTVMQNAVTIAMSYKPMFLEYWANDAMNPEFAGIIQQATKACQMC
jgi:hypothetical protein